MDVSIIKEMPKGRIPVKTFIKSEEEMKDVLELMYEEISTVKKPKNTNVLERRGQFDKFTNGKQ